MGKIIYLMGKSSTGKDTLFKRLLHCDELSLKAIVPYTTRPIREGEKQGVEYYFTDEKGYHDLVLQGKVIEQRSYNTYHGLWRYFTVDDAQINTDANNYILIGTLESFLQTEAYFGRDKMLPILIELDDGIRLRRAIDRESEQKYPRYEELCRRFLADSEDFSEEKLKKAGDIERFNSDNIADCERKVIAYIKQFGN